MKKTISILGITMLLFGANVNAQNADLEPRETISFGIKAGLNVSNVWDENGQDFRADPKAGFAGGIFFGFPIGMYLGFQPEFMVSQKGFKGSGTLFSNQYSFARTTTFLDVPLLLQVKPADFLTILLGPQFSYLFNQKDVYTYGVNSVEQEQEFRNDNFRKNILGFVVGADVNISHLVLSGRLGWDFQTNSGDGSSFTPRYKNRLVQFTVGYKI